MSVTIGDIAIDIRAKMDRLQSDMDQAKTAVRSGTGEMQAMVNVLSGYMAAIGVGNLGGLINSTIEAAAALKHLSEKTGATVEGLSAIKAVARASGTDIDSVAAAMNKLSKNLTDTDEDAKGAAQGIRALGLDFDTLKRMTPDQQMLEVAKAMSQFKDSAAKSQTAMLLFGKAGADMLPMLHDLAEKGNLNGRVTKEQAESADAFEKQLIKLKASMEGMLRSAILPLLSYLGTLGPLLTAAAQIAAAYFAVFIAAPTIILLVTTAFNGMALAMVENGVAAGILNTSIMTLGPTFTALTAEMGIFKVAMLTTFGVLAAAFAGWEIGRWLSENFVEARLAGIAMVEGLMVAWEYMKYGAEVAWLGIKAAAGSALEWVGSAMATLLEKMSGGLSFVGMSSAAESVKGYAAALRETTASATDFTSEHAALDAGLESSKAGIRAITGDMAEEAIASFNAAKASKANGDAKADLVVQSAKHAKAEKEVRDKIAEVIDKLKDEILILHMAADAAEIYKKQREAGADADSAAGREIANLVTQFRAEKSVIDTAKAAMTDAEKAMEALTAANLREITTISDAIEKEKFRIQTLGLSRTAVEELKLAKMEDALLDAQRAMDDPEVKRLQNIIGWQRQWVATVRSGDIADANKKAADDSAAWWTKASEQIEKSLTDALVNGLGKGKDLFTSLRDYIVHGFESMVIRMAVQPVMAGIGSALGMGSANASGGGGSGSGGVGSSLSTVGSLFGAGGMISNGISSVGASMMNGSMSATFGDLGASLVANSSAIASAIPYVGAALLAVTALKSAMDYTVEANGGAITATVGSGGASGVTNRTDSIQHGGLFGGGTTHNSSYAAADAGTTGYIDQSIIAVTAANHAYAEVLGLNATAMDGYTATLDINTSGMDAAATKLAINGAIAQFSGDQVASAFGSVLESFAHAGESAAQTMQRLAEVSVVADGLNSLGGVFSNIAAGGINATESMISLAGGLDQLIAKSKAFVASYYSDTEQAGIAARGVMAALTAAGISAEMINGLSSKADFRRLVESIDITTQTGREQVNALLDIAPQFASLSGALQTQGGTLSTLTQLAPQIAALQPVLNQGASDQRTATETAATNTQTAINAVTTATTAGTTAVVAAINNLAGSMQAVAISSASTAASVSGRQGQPMLVQVVSV